MNVMENCTLYLWKFATTLEEELEDTALQFPASKALHEIANKDDTG